jgi:hypothetical protein
MKPTHHRTGRMIRQSFVLIISVFLQIFCSQAFSQQDSLRLISKGSLVRINDIKFFAPADTLIHIPASFRKENTKPDSRTDSFYDSLKIRASRKFFTKSLIDLVIVRPDSSNQKKITTRSDERFESYRGMRIRKISVQRINVFGTDIYNPGYYNSGRMENVLNQTHVNTAEKIILKNLLFREGDTVSALRLSENERVLRQLPYIDDARIIVVPVTAEEADIVVLTKDVYSLGARYDLKSKYRGSLYLFDKNMFGSGHEFRIELPYNTKNSDSPGIGLYYYLNNIKKSFVNLTLSYYNGLGKTLYGVSAIRNLVTSETKYAGGITINQVYTTALMDTVPLGKPLHYNYQDYYLLRSFLTDREKVKRIIAGIRFINDNIFVRPEINPDSYYALQKKALLLGSLTFSKQKFYKTNLIYSYGRTEDLPYGGMVRLTGGIERNEFKNRAYMAFDWAVGGSVSGLGYFQYSAGLGGFLRTYNAEQGILTTKLLYVSNLSILGSSKIRNFVTIDFTRGFARYSDEYLSITRQNGFTGFRNDSLRGGQRVRLSLESVLFTPGNYLGFRFAIFGFADMAFLAGTKQVISDGFFLTGIGLGLRIRNDNLVLNTFQVRIGFFPFAPEYSKLNHFLVSGEQLLRPPTFDPGPPALIPYR